MITRNIVRGIIYDDFDGERKYLVIKTVKDYWQNVQGGIESNEGEKEALVREIKEETNLENAVVLLYTRVFIEYNTIRKGEKIHTKLMAYAAKVDHNQEIKLCSGEDGHTEYKWANFSEVLELLVKFPEQRIVFLDVVKKINARKY